jgi:hypothetical protein
LTAEIKSALELMKSKTLQGEGGLQDLKMALEQLQLKEETSNLEQQGTITIVFYVAYNSKARPFYIHNT